jgi:DNA-binding MarR family transcriptional regulator
MARDLLSSVMGVLGVGELTLVQMGTLILLDGVSPEPMSIKALAARVTRSLPATSRMLDQLVKRGLVQRREDPQDRRVRQISISPAGQELIGGIMRRRVEAQQALMSFLDASEREQVMRGMELLAEAARRRDHGSRASTPEPPAADPRPARRPKRGG